MTQYNAREFKVFAQLVYFFYSSEEEEEVAAETGAVQDPEWS